KHVKSNVMVVRNHTTKQLNQVVSQVYSEFTGFNLGCPQSYHKNFCTNLLIGFIYLNSALGIDAIV
ncbi:hypothetical protein, partial [Crocinitomix algicola]|uniref:hypothetical protein n=1 Tax=Crocinitomix algicola TaxID=1740263 RepID=UPI001C2FBD61